MIVVVADVAIEDDAGWSWRYFGSCHADGGGEYLWMDTSLYENINSVFVFMEIAIFFVTVQREYRNWFMFIHTFYWYFYLYI